MRTKFKGTPPPQNKIEQEGGFNLLKVVRDFTSMTQGSHRGMTKSIIQFIEILLGKCSGLKQTDAGIS